MDGRHETKIRSRECFVKRFTAKIMKNFDNPKQVEPTPEKKFLAGSPGKQAYMIGPEAEDLAKNAGMSAEEKQRRAFAKKMEIPKWRKEHVRSWIHHIESGHHADLHMRFIMPSFNFHRIGLE